MYGSVASGVSKIIYLCSNTVQSYWMYLVSTSVVMVIAVYVQILSSV